MPHRVVAGTSDLDDLPVGVVVVAFPAVIDKADQADGPEERPDTPKSATASVSVRTRARSGSEGGRGGTPNAGDARSQRTHGWPINMKPA